MSSTIGVQTWIAAGLLAGALCLPLETQAATGRYPRMAPIGQYLMDRGAEIALARTAAPPAISQDATILVLTPRGYQVAIKGANGFVCMVERGWVGALDWPEMWNPKIRGADCLNAAAARSVLPLAELRTSLFLSGHSVAGVVAALKTALSTRQIPRLEPGAMSYMMSEQSYLTDHGSHNMPHLMFFEPAEDPSAWGAGAKGSPVNNGGYWFFSRATERQTGGLPPMSVFTIEVGSWSDGHAASMGPM